jgi:hypothetical protein
VAMRMSRLLDSELTSNREAHLQEDPSDARSGLARQDFRRDDGNM